MFGVVFGHVSAVWFPERGGGGGQGMENVNSAGGFEGTVPVADA